MKSKCLYLSLLPVCSFAAGSENVTQTKPNILWINMDDLGIELGCYNNKDVRTPNIDRLASEGILYSNCYVTSPVSSPSRSSMLTGMYPPSINSIDHRTMAKTDLPAGIKPITDYFKAAGYFCTNGSGQNMNSAGKADYNFNVGNLYDGTDWNNRAPGQPFFAQVQITEPHRVFKTDTSNPINPDAIHLPDCYLNHPLLRADWALYLETIQNGDKRVGQFLDRLVNEGLANNTIVILFGDNGRPHLRDKQFLYEGGLRVPLIIRWPGKINAGQVDNQLISLIDVTATSLSMAGIQKPDYMQGNVFVGDNTVKREYVFGFRQRMGDAVDDSRSISDGRYKLIWNRMPDMPWMQMSGYKKMMYPAFSLYHVLYQQGKLPAPYSQFMAEKKPEVELYDLKEDPSEFNNLADVSDLSLIQQRLLKTLKDSLLVFEENMIPEKPEFTQAAKNESRTFYVNGMRGMGLNENSTYSDIIAYYEKKLNVKPIISSNFNEYTLFTDQTPEATSTLVYELGTKFRSTQTGEITKIRFYKHAAETGSHTGRIWSATGEQLASVNFTNETSDGWQVAELSTPLRIAANTTYVVSVNANAGYYYSTFTAEIINGILSTDGIVSSGVYNTKLGAFPGVSFSKGRNYFRDVVLKVDATGINNPKKSKLTVSPVSKGVFSVEVPEGSNIDVINSMGVVVYSGKSTANNTRLDLTGKKGMYIVRLNNGEKVGKIIVD